MGRRRSHSVSEVPKLELSLYRMLADLFPGRERRRLLGVFGMSVLAAFFETLGIASILPFLALVLDPAAIQRYPVFRHVMQGMGIQTTQGGLILAGVATALVIALGNTVVAANVFVQYRFVARTEIRLATALFSGYLRQPYPFHVQRDAPSLLNVLTPVVTAVVYGIVMPCALALSKLVMVVAVLLLLFVRDPIGASVVSCFLIATYWVTFHFVRAQQHRKGIAANAANEARARLSQEALGGVKELQVLGRLQPSMDRYAEAVTVASRASATMATVALLPRYVLETVAFGGILLATLVLVAGSSGNTQAVVPVLALYAFAGYRLMPGLQTVFGAAVALRYYGAPLRALHADYVRVVTDDATKGESQRPPVSDTAVRLRKEFRLEDISFTYAGAPSPALRNVSLVIHPAESVGLVGRTGAGKTTLADVILGLYEVDSGRVTVDGVALTGSGVRAWQRRVGYVPQSVFLSNASVRENIAFGIAPAQIDDQAVRHAARMAQADEFIQTYPAAYDTIVGERGVRLSGGQRQRIGIARALYHQPDVLVFDEATSALDGLTEDALMEEIRSLAGERTIILIAHRLRTVEACDRIVMLDQGRIIADGPYEELVHSSAPFRRLVRGSASEKANGAAERVT